MPKIADALAKSGCDGMAGAAGKGIIGGVVGDTTGG
jgi:2C-methyl-D-erythritol 2,4-cyclodiphosphate synthase